MTAWLQYRYDALFTDKVSPPFNADPVGLFLEEKLLSAHAWPVFIDRMPKVLLKGKFEPAFRLLPVMKAGEKRRSTSTCTCMGWRTLDSPRIRRRRSPTSPGSLAKSSQFRYPRRQGAPSLGRTSGRILDSTSKPRREAPERLDGNIEADFLQTNWQTSKFDQAFFDTIQKMDIGKAKVDDTYAALAKGLQGVLDLSPA